jgi:antitoxin CptB
MADATESTSVGRLRWRCRRGTRELDAMLGWWLEQRHAQAGSAQREDFDRLLDVQDPDLWDWLTGNATPRDPGFGAIIDEIRAHHRI